MLKLLSSVTKLINENVKKPVGCSKFHYDTPEYKLCKELNNSKYRDIITPAITKVLDIKKKKWLEAVPKEDQKKIFEVLGKLKDIDPNKKWQWPSHNIDGKFVIGTIDEFVKNRLPFLSFIYDEEYGTTWSPINKLDTNYSDAAILITDIVKMSKSFDAKEIIDDLNNGDSSKLRSVMNTIESHAPIIYSKFLVNTDLYSQNSYHNTMEGEEVETLVLKTMEDDGWTLIHRGGGGDPIDVLLGVDLIMEKDGELKTIQCKKVWGITYQSSTLLKPTEGSFRISGKPYVSKQRNLDFVGYGTLTGEVVVAKRQKEVIMKDNQYQYTDKLILPSPVGASTYFYIDNESIIAKSKNI